MGDYLSDDFFREVEGMQKHVYEKLDQVVYNPKKGKKYIEFIERRFPQLKFVPIIDMSREEVITTLSSPRCTWTWGNTPERTAFPAKQQS